MAIPHDEDIQRQLFYLLARAPEGTKYCQDAYRLVAEHFPELTRDEVTAPYRRSLSHWANRVQFARWRLVEQGKLLRRSPLGRGFWTISPAGRDCFREQQELADRLLDELKSFDGRGEADASTGDAASPAAPVRQGGSRPEPREA